MYCLNCGAQLSDTAKFCHVCGTVVQRATPPPAAAASPLPTSTPTPRAVPRRLLGCGVALLGATLLMGLVLISAYFILGLHKDSGITELAPDDAVAVVVIRPSLLQLNQLRDTDRIMGSAAALAPLLAVPDMPDFLFSVYGDYGGALEGMNINSTEDVLPWIGREVALAAGPDGSVLAAAAVRNEAKAGAFLVEVREQLEDEGIEFDESDHGGVTITEVVGPEFYTPLAFAITDGRLLLASGREMLEDALDRADSGRKTLADNGAFRDALAAQPANRIGTIYIDPAALGGEVQSFDALRWIGGSSMLTGNGTRFSYRFGFDSSRLDREQREWMERDGIKNDLARRIPEDTLFYFAGSNLGGTLEYASRIPDLGDALDELRSEDALSDLFRLMEGMTGEFAVALTADEGGLLYEMTGDPFGMIFTAQVENGDDALAELSDTFDDIARQTFSDHETDEIGRATVGYLDISMEGGRILGYGVEGDDVVVGTSENLIEAAMQPKDRLADAPLFKDTLGALPGGGLLYFYFDADVIDRLSNELGINAEAFDEYTRRIEAIGLAVEPLNRAGEMNAELFFLTERPRR